jgi:hypothetical protein
MRNGMVAVTFCDTVLLQPWASLAHVLGGTLLHDSLVTNLVIFPHSLHSAGGLPKTLTIFELTCVSLASRPTILLLFAFVRQTFGRKPEGIPFDIFTISDSRDS